MTANLVKNRKTFLDSEMQQALKTDFEFQNEINITPTGTNEFIDITGDEQID